eukprot:2410572-Alexandrium_andersonii.AAC.1
MFPSFLQPAACAAGPPGHASSSSSPLPRHGCRLLHWPVALDAPLAACRPLLCVSAQACWHRSAIACLCS